ncbi:hypothetical protein, partial [Pseudomonas aeruginosa]|uniref:hypothetical protein n=1 Tax=Pseudomonas aeruginosa TaxID=287 RepID=UPI0021AC7F3C
MSKSVLNMPANKCKIVCIYDFDCMTSEAQMALRRIIELYAHRVRFIFICNNLNNVIEAIQSRTLTLKFNSLTVECIIERLHEIADLNQLNLPVGIPVGSPVGSPV